MNDATVFKNPRWARQIDENGFAVIPFLSDKEITELLDFYHSLNNLPLKGTHVTMFNPSYRYRKLVDEKIKAICRPLAEEMIDGYRALYSNFMVKEPGKEGDFPLHQDWTYVDESENASYAIWCPLCDVDEGNGALQMIGGSHRLATCLRGPYIHEPFGPLQDVIKEKYSTSVNLKAGEALVWDHRLLHFSKPNNSKEPRLAFTLIMVPQDAPVIHCFGLPGSEKGEIEIYSVDTDFFMHYEISKKPVDVPLLTRVTQPSSDFELSEFNRLLNL